MHKIATLVAACALGIFVAGGTGYARDPAATNVKRADFAGETVTEEVRHIADWAVHSGDHRGLPFIVVDKAQARAAAFDAAGRLMAVAPVLIGIGVGDTFPPGVAALEMHQTTPSQRITPAGRFFAAEDRNLQGQRVLWVDYDAGIAMHKMPTKKTSERRPERMASPSPADHRITFGCINVPAAFYEDVVTRHFRRKGGFVYVLPDTAPLKTVFNSYDVGSPAAQAPAQAAVLNVSAPAVRRF